MASRRFLPVVAILSLTASSVLAAPRRTLQRSSVLAVETRFNSKVKIQAAFLSWQTYDEIRPRQKGMETGFRCDADVAENETSYTLSCKVPLGVADGNYYLTSIFVRAGDFEQKYSWHDEPFYVVVQIRGGEEVPLPQLRSVVAK